MVPVWGGSWCLLSAVRSMDGLTPAVSCQLPSCSGAAAARPGCSAPRQAAASMTLLTGGGHVRIMPSPRPGHMTPVHNPGLKHLTI